MQQCQSASDANVCLPQTSNAAALWFIVTYHPEPKVWTKNVDSRLKQILSRFPGWWQVYTASWRFRTMVGHC